MLEVPAPLLFGTEAWLPGAAAPPVSARLDEVLLAKEVGKGEDDPGREVGAVEGVQVGMILELVIVAGLLITVVLEDPPLTAKPPALVVKLLEAPPLQGGSGG